MKECDELSARVERVSAELAEARRRAEAASAAAARADVRLRSADAQKASLAAEVDLVHQILWVSATAVARDQSSSRLCSYSLHCRVYKLPKWIMPIDIHKAGMRA